MLFVILKIDDNFWNVQQKEVYAPKVSSLTGTTFSNLNKRAAISTQNDRIISKSLRTIYNFGNATSENIDKITEATKTLYLAQTAVERRIQLAEIDIHR